MLHEMAEFLITNQQSLFFYIAVVCALQIYSSVNYKYDVYERRKHIVSIELSANWDRNLVQRTPAAEKARLASSDVAGIDIR